MPLTAQSALVFTTDPTNPTPVFQAYAARRADVHQVFRALVGYRNWLVPAGVLARRSAHGAPPQRLRYGPAAIFPPGELWLFTDGDAADRAVAAGCELGDYASGLAGVELFGAGLAGLSAVRVNPVSPPELTWNLPSEAFDAARAWAEVVAFENLLGEVSLGGPPSLLAIAAYQHFQAFVFPNRTVLTMPDQGGLRNPAVVCTAPDCAKAILLKVPEPMRAELQVVTTEGRELMDKLPDQGMDGLILNPAGPGPRLPLRLAQN